MDDFTNNWLKKFGIKTKPRINKASDTFSLDRYRKIPLHAIFLYTSEDKVVSNYIINHWGALDFLSGNYCDIHHTLDQFEFKEDAYDFIEGLHVMKDSNINIISNLPGIFFWDMEAQSSLISLSSIETESELTKLLRNLFVEIKKKPQISTVKKFKPHNKAIGNNIVTNKFQAPWWIISATCGALSILIYKILEYNPQWVDEGFIGVSITIFVLMLNPKRRFYKAFWTSMTLLTSITLFPAFNFSAGVKIEQLGKIEKILYDLVIHDPHWMIYIVLGIVAIVAIILDYFERKKPS